MMPVLDEAGLKKQLDQNDLQNLYVLYGDEKYLVNRAAKRLIKKAAGTAFLEFNLNELTNQTAVDRIAESAEALPLMSERKCTAVSDFNIEEKDKTELSKLEELISSIPESTTLVFHFPTLTGESMKTAKFKKFLKSAAKYGVVTEFGRRTPAELQKVLIKDAQKAGCVLSKQNAAKLVEYAGNDLKALLNENAKLCAYAAGGEITSDMIESMVSKSIETTVFILSNALLAGNYEKAYQHMDQLFQTKAEPIVIVAVLGSAYTDMYRVRASVESGKGTKGPASYGEYRGKEFRLSKAEKSARGISEEGLRKSLSILLETDALLKSSRISPRILLDEMIAKLLLAAKGEKSP